MHAATLHKGRALAFLQAIDGKQKGKRSRPASTARQAQFHGGHGSEAERRALTPCARTKAQSVPWGHGSEVHGGTLTPGLGTLGFAAPEMASGTCAPVTQHEAPGAKREQEEVRTQQEAKKRAKRYGPPVDVYSWGCFAFEVLPWEETFHTLGKKRLTPS